MTTTFRCKAGDFGFTWVFTIENVDYSAYTPKLYVWNDLATSIVDGGTCTATLSDGDTLVSYVVQDGDFDTGPATYNAEIEFTNSTFLTEKSETFKIVIESSHPIVPIVP